MLSISACGTGLNLTKASIVIFAEISWSVGNILQAEDRVHRIGQHAATVRIIYVLAGWSDDIVWVCHFFPFSDSQNIFSFYFTWQYQLDIS